MFVKGWPVYGIYKDSLLGEIYFGACENLHEAQI
jgi:hypothetical protein